jgi:hypothetical protein
MKNLDNAVKQEIGYLREQALDEPEFVEEIRAKGFGVFCLWLNLSGYLPDDENDTIAKMRDFCTDFRSKK